MPSSTVSARSGTPTVVIASAPHGRHEQRQLGTGSACGTNGRVQADAFVWCTHRQNTGGRYMAARLWPVVGRADTRRKLSMTATALSSRPHEVNGFPLELVEAKVHMPAPRPGSVRRTALVNRLRAARSVPVITLVAPAGYGKTTVLAQWAERDERPFAWIALDERDAGASALVKQLAAALAGLGAVAPPVLRSPKSSGPSSWASAA